MIEIILHLLTYSFGIYVFYKLGVQAKHEVLVTKTAIGAHEQYRVYLNSCEKKPELELKSQPLETPVGCEAQVCGETREERIQRYLKYSESCQHGWESANAGYKVLLYWAVPFMILLFGVIAFKFASALLTPLYTQYFG